MLLQGLIVAIDAESRAPWFAARCLRDLGARIVTSKTRRGDEVDQLWLGGPDIVEKLNGADLVICDRSSNSHQPDAAPIVVYSPSARDAVDRDGFLGERELAAVGGIAVAVGDPDRGPLHLPAGCVDALIGTHLAAAGLAALIECTSHTEVVGSDIIAWAVATNLQLYLPYGLPWCRSGRRASGSGSCYPWSLFDAQDGLFCLIGRTDRDWRALKEAMGNPAWCDEPRFADPRTVGRYYAEAADAYVAPWVARHTRARLTARLGERSFACAPALRPEEVVQIPALDGRWCANTPEPGIRVPGPVQDISTTPAPLASRTRLADLLVLDLSWVWSGPAVSVGLADLGATVIKVESSLRPDNSRLRGQPQDGSAGHGGPAHEMTPYFHALNRGKKSISLNLTTQAGRGILKRLAGQADVIIENLTAGVMDRWGVSPAQVHAINPGCVFLSMRGYRDHPSTRGLRAYAPTLSSMAGIEALIGYPGEAPLGAMNVAFSDVFASSQGIMLALAGVLGRNAVHRGGAIELSQFEAAVLANGRNIIAAQLDRVEPLTPFQISDPKIVEGQDLAESKWISADLFADVQPRWLDRVSVAVLPWRRNGVLPQVAGAGPVLGADTKELLGSHLGMRRSEIAVLEDSGALA